MRQSLLALFMLTCGCMAPKNQVDDYVDKRATSRAEKVVEAHETQFAELHERAHKEHGAGLRVMEFVAFLSRNQGWLIGVGGGLLGLAGTRYGVAQKRKASEYRPKQVIEAVRA